MKQLTKYCSAFFLALLLTWVTGCASTDEVSDTRAESSQTPGAYIDDSMITTKVKAAIFNEPGLSAAEINVETYQGDVQLSGFVESEEDITRAVEVAQRVEGVRSVQNNMQVKQSRYR